MISEDHLEVLLEETSSKIIMSQRIARNNIKVPEIQEILLSGNHNIHHSNKYMWNNHQRSKGRKTLIMQYLMYLSLISQEVRKET